MEYRTLKSNQEEKKKYWGSFIFISGDKDISTVIKSHLLRQF